MLLSLALIWGSSFLLTKIAVASLAPDLVVAGRLLVAALILAPLAWLIAERPAGGARLWIFYLLIAIFGNVLPFFLIAWGQTAIDSGLAGILMAIMPLATLGLAHFLVPGERMTPPRLVGFLIGFVGVVVLMGPDALAGLGNGDGRLLHMLAVLGGALSYGVSAILARLRPASDAYFSAASTVTIALTLGLVVLGLGGGLSVQAVPSGAGLLAVILLGMVSTALATIIYFHLVRSAGPSFLAQLNYLIPLWAVLVGVIFLGEQPELNHLYGLALILGGILVTHARWHGRAAHSKRSRKALAKRL